MLKLKYNKKIDMLCWQRVIEAGSIFGMEEVKKIAIDEQKIKIAKGKRAVFQEEIDVVEANFRKNIKVVFGLSFPKNMDVFINTTPYSMDDYQHKRICISYERSHNFITSFLHEANHYTFRRKYEKICKDKGFSQEAVENIKEILTVINNIAFSDIMKTSDFGWEKHKMIRRQVYQDFEKNRNFKKTLDNLLDFLSKNKISF